MADRGLWPQEGKAAAKRPRNGDWLGLRGRGLLESPGPASCAACWWHLSELPHLTQRGPGRENELHLHPHVGPPQMRGRKALGDISGHKSTSQVLLDKHLVKCSIQKLSGS